MDIGVNFVSLNKKSLDGFDFFYENDKRGTIPISKTNIVPLKDFYRAAESFLSSGRNIFLLKWQEL